MSRLWLCVGVLANILLMTYADSVAVANSDAFGTNARSIADSTAIADDSSCPGEDECPKNEVYSLCTQRLCKPKLCSERGQPVKCEKISSKQCKPGCVCKDGYLRNNNATCVPENKCGTDCADSEVLDSCPSICDSQYCQTRNGTSTDCPTPTKCPPAVCKCRFNYRRAENGTCIPTRDCPAFSCKAKPNEEYNACPPLCPAETCGLPACTGRCPFRILIVLNCSPTCRCVKGFCRQNGTCIPCGESPDVCPANETFSTCIQGECRALNCSQVGKPVACPRSRIDPAYCQTGCICKENFYRAENGKCVPKEQCKKNACQPNEEPSTCVQGLCRAQNCTQKGQPVPCPLILDGYCERGCVCKEGYLRDASGCCIPEDKCPVPTCPKNEVYSTTKKDCPPETCFSLVARINCEANQPIYSGCVCQSGYLRLNSTSPCIPQCDCPEMEGSLDCKCTCPANEVFSNCTQAVCRAQNCAQKGIPVKCVKITKGSCRPGCICEQGYLRNSTGTCVPECKCPSPAPICSKNEVYSTTKKDCPPDTCISLVAKFKCDANQPVYSGCVCQSGYKRLNTTTPCVPICECPEMKSSLDCKCKNP